MPYALAVFVALFFAVPVYAGELTGSAAAELRLFTGDANFPGQNKGSGLSLVLEPEYFHQWNDDQDTLTIAPFFRFDRNDSDRSHVDMRELNWLHAKDDWELRVGLGKVFWGVTESNHLVDIINQTDGVENVDGEDKLGQPMIQAALFKDWGALRLFILPGFRERTFPGSEGRLRAAVPVDTDNATYESGAEERRIDGAIRYETILGDWDIGLAHFSGTSREARLLSAVNAAGLAVLRPHYDVIEQSSIDIQLTRDAWLWKFEGISRSGQGERFTAFSGGFEYSFFGVGETDADIGLLMEYHRDDRGPQAPATLLQDDLFTGVRLVLNDVPDTQFLAGSNVDTKSKMRSYFVEAGRRVGDRWKIEAEARFFTGNSDPGFESEDFILLRLARYF